MKMVQKNSGRVPYPVMVFAIDEKIENGYKTPF